MKRIFNLLLLMIFSAFVVVSFIYLLVPGPKAITDFQALPDSTQSKLSGDTIQVPNVVAYFSDHYRDYVIPFYLKDYFQGSKLPFKPLILIHPPQYAYTAIKDQTQSTYLVELTYPMRDSLYINGMEPFDENGNSRFEGASMFAQDEKEFETKVTLRYYPSKVFFRVVIWFGLNLSIIVLWFTSKKILFNA